MAFNPDDYLKKKKEFNPDNYLNSKSEVDPNQISKLESLLRGGAQGATLGFGDELTGAGESALGSLGLVPDKTYEQSRNEARKNNEKAQASNPLTYGTGQVGGALASTLLTGGAAGAGQVGILGAAGIGAGAGAIQGLGESEAGIGDANLYTDAAKSAAIGGLTGGALKGAGKLVGKLGGDELGRVFTAAKSGKSIIGDKAAAGLNNELKDTVGALANKVTSEADQAGKVLGAAKSAIKPENIRTTQEGLEQVADELSKDMNSGMFNGVVEKLKNMSANLDNMSAKDVERQMSLIENDMKGAGLAGEYLHDAMAKVESAVFSNNPEMAKALGAAKDAYRPAATAKAALKNVNDSEFSSDVIKRDNLINQLTQKAKTGANDATNDASNALDSIEKFTNAPELMDKLRGTADNLKLNKDVSTAFEPSKLIKVFPALKATAYGAADVAGTAVNQFNSSATVESASKLAQKLGNSGLGKKITDTLALEPTMRDRALFVLSQQPWFRTLTKDDKK